MINQAPSVLFICTGNAGRSQISETLFRRLAGERAEVMSAGVEPWKNLHPVAVRLMNERGLDMKGQSPKHVNTLSHRQWDVVVTIGEPAQHRTPELAGNPRQIHWPISDPADADPAGPAAQENAFRVTIAEIELRLPELFKLVTTHPTARQLRMVPGISTLCVIPDYDHLAFDPISHVPLIAAAGFRCLELDCFYGSAHFSWDLTDHLQKLAQLLVEHQLPLYSFHAVRDEVTLPDARERRLMIDILKANADAAAMLGASVVVIHAGLPANTERAQGEAILQETLTELSEHAMTMPCRFGWENDAAGLTAEEHLAWLRRFNPGGLGLVLDVGHAHNKRDFDAYMTGAGLRLASLHIHDNNGSEDEHRLPGQGSINWNHFMQSIENIKYTGPLMLEVMNRDGTKDLQEMLGNAMTAWRRMRTSE